MQREEKVLKFCLERWRSLEGFFSFKLSDTCPYIPRDAVMMWHSRKCPVICPHRTLGSLLPAPKSLSAVFFLPVWMKLSLLPDSPPSLFHFSLLKSNLSQTCWSFFFLFRGWIFSPPCPIPFVPQMVKKSSPFVPGLLWHCSTSGFVWREGQEVENPPSLPSLLFLSLTTEHCSLLGHCEYFYPIRMDSTGVGGHMWPFMDQREEVVDGRGGLIWGFLWPLCQGMCVHSHHLLATNTETKACRHTLSLAMCPILAHHKWHHKALDCIVLSFPLFQWEHVLCALY